MTGVATFFTGFAGFKLREFVGDKAITVNVSQNGNAAVAIVTLYEHHGNPPVPVATKSGSTVVFDNLPDDTLYNLIAVGVDGASGIGTDYQVNTTSSPTRNISLDGGSGSGSGSGSSASAVGIMSRLSMSN